MTWLLAERSRLLRFHDGDRDTLADAFRAYAPGLVAFLRHDDDARRAAPARDALARDDLVVRVFARAFTRDARRTFEGPRPFATFLVPIARALLADDANATSDAPDATIARLDDGEAGAGPPWRGAPLTRAQAAFVTTFTATLSDEERAIFALRFVSDLPRRDVSARTLLSPMAVRERESALRRALMDALAALHAPRDAACTEARGELAQLFIEGNTRHLDATLAHARACPACRALYDDFATIEPSEAVLLGEGGFRPDVDLAVPPRLAARVAACMPDDVSEEVPYYARVSGHLVSTIALSLAAMAAVAFVTRGVPEKTKELMVALPAVSMRVACALGEGEGRRLFVVDEGLPASRESGVRHDCPRGARLALTARAARAGKAVALVDGAPVFGPTTIARDALTALSGGLALDERQGSPLVVRLVFVEGEVDDVVVRERAEHPLPHDVVVEQQVVVSPAE